MEDMGIAFFQANMIPEGVDVTLTGTSKQTETLIQKLDETGQFDEGLLESQEYICIE